MFSRPYLALIRRVDGRSGPFPRFFAWLLDLEMRMHRRFRELDARMRRPVYLELRRLVESDERAVTALARTHACILFGVVGGLLAGAVAGAIWAHSNRTGFPVPDGVTFLTMVIASGVLGTFVGGLLAAIAGRLIMARTGPSKEEWKAFVDAAFASVQPEAEK